MKIFFRTSNALESSVFLQRYSERMTASERGASLENTLNSILSIKSLPKARGKFEKTYSRSLRVAFVQGNKAFRKYFAKNTPKGIYDGMYLKSGGQQNDVLVASFKQQPAFRQQFLQFLKRTYESSQKRSASKGLSSLRKSVEVSRKEVRATVKGNRVNVRINGAGTTPIGTLNRRDRISYLGEVKGNYLKIRMPNGKVGWAYKSFIEVKGNSRSQERSSAKRSSRRETARRRKAPERVSSGRLRVYDGMPKKVFLSQNKGFFQKQINAVNNLARKKIGRSAVMVSLSDVMALFNSELAVGRSGGLRVKATHSEGEKGLFPLPEGSLNTWLGVLGLRKPSGTARPDINIKTAIEVFSGYKNYSKHRNYFKQPGIKGNSVKEAQVLAAITHGYFYSGTYRDGRVPTSRILRGIARGKSVSDIMRGTTYKHAGKKLMVNRQNNINEGLRMV